MPAVFTSDDPRSSYFTFDPPTTPTNFASSARKRSRPGLGPYNAHNSTTPGRQMSNWSNVSAADSIAWSADAASPAPLVDTRYIFAGGISTPSAGEDLGDSYERPDQSEDALFRRRWSMANSAHEEAQGSSSTGDQTESSKRKMSSPNAAVESSPGWGKMVVNLVGGVAGKMWNFCTGAAFSGFHAGGGQGYDLKLGPDMQHQNFQTAESVWEDLDSRISYSNSWEHSRIPGQFPEDPVTFDSDKQDATPPRPSKRIHTDTGSGWVMVSHDLDRSDSRASSPRLSARREPSMLRPSTPSHIPRPSQPRRNSSTNSQRKSLVPVSRRNTATSGISFAGSPGPRMATLRNSTSTPTTTTTITTNTANTRNNGPTTRTASFASPRASPRTRERQYTRESYGTPALAAPVKTGSPLSPEVQQYAARLRREEREADASMNRLGAQLAALIREGKEALQSSPNAYGEGEGEDEGFEDGRW